MHKLILILSTLAIVVIVAGTILYAITQGIDVLSPAGIISSHQRDLFYIAVALGLAAFIPVLVMTYIIIMRYRSSDTPGNHRFRNFHIRPEASWIWAGFVTLIITALSVFLLKSTFAIDPYLPIHSQNESMNVRVIALPWKWLFIYPQEGIATVNELVIPVDTPVKFDLIADAPMSSFWIPKLGGMIYTMEGMVTNINLMATETGEYEGMNTEINGEGYSNMRFITRAVTNEVYADWVDEVRQSPQYLSFDAYDELAKKSIDHPIERYASSDPAIFGTVLMKFMDHSGEHGHDQPSQTSVYQHGVHSAH